MELANHGLILLQQLNAQREFGFLCDCTVAIGDVFFKAHKAVLAAFSNYFRMLFIHQDRSEEMCSDTLEAKWWVTLKKKKTTNIKLKGRLGLYFYHVLMLPAAFLVYFCR